MPEEAFISLGPDRAELFRWAGDRLVQAIAEREGEVGPVGGVHLGRVVKLERALNAAFVEIGLERPGLLPLKKHDAISEGDAIAVEVRRDAREEKGVRLSRARVDTAAIAGRTPPSLLVPPPMLWQKALATFAPERVEQIHCDRRGDAERVTEWCRRHAKELLRTIHHLPRREWSGNEDAQEQIGAALQEEVALEEGGTLLFEPVRTLTAIDVNSGGASARRGEAGGGMEQTALSVNLAAAREIPIQLALRNLGGVIVIDFIDMENRNKREKVIETLGEAAIVDPAIDWIGTMSRLGLVEMRRRRSGPTLAEMWAGRAT
ncbi:MAG TPA: ribonuclease E/G [Candidatus Cybelea sp.]|nr:ribonuclease E/G [Candidatus Cybelea sp.]